MKFITTTIFLVLFVSINANPHGYVVEVAKVASPVGSHGPALINLHWPNSWPGSYWGKEQGGSWGSSGNGGSNEGNSGSNNNGWSNGGWDNGGSVGYTGDSGHGHDGKYIAINRGSIHVAPLVGHTQSVKSQNYQPAPGTTW